MVSGIGRGVKSVWNGVFGGGDVLLANANGIVAFDGRLVSGSKNVSSRQALATGPESLNPGIPYYSSEDKAKQAGRNGLPQSPGHLTDEGFTLFEGSNNKYSRITSVKDSATGEVRKIIEYVEVEASGEHKYEYWSVRPNGETARYLSKTVGYFKNSDGSYTMKGSVAYSGEGNANTPAPKAEVKVAWYGALTNDSGAVAEYRRTHFEVYDFATGNIKGTIFNNEYVSHSSDPGLFPDQYNTASGSVPANLYTDIMPNLNRGQVLDWGSRVIPNMENNRGFHILDFNGSLNPVIRPSQIPVTNPNPWMLRGF
ncbi:hypothetical protein EHQ13_13415 [Leptospira gomenensis]|nr:hypothetical protein EHQ13_13415 [Leptospira gomenensis]